MLSEDEIAKGWRALVAAFPSHEVTEDTLHLWASTLGTLPPQLFRKGIQHVIVTHRYHTFPTLAEILEGALADDTTFDFSRGCSPEQKLELYRRREVEAAQRAEIGNQAPKRLNGTADHGKPDPKEQRIAELEKEVRDLQGQILTLQRKLDEKSRVERIEERRVVLLKQAEELGVEFSGATKGAEQL